MSTEHPTPTPALHGGRYRLDSVIGSGGMGRVHRAWDTRLGRRVAIKVLSPELAADPAVSARLRAEGQLLAALQHPNLVTLHDIPDDPDATYLVMELVEGESLAARLRRDGPLPAREVSAIVTGVAAGLSALHGTGIAHGDVSPANVLLGIDGRARLADLGLARDLAAAIPAGDGLIHGTLRYLAPERLEGTPASPAADVYALAAVTYATLLGRPPAVATDVIKLRAALAEPPIRPSLLRAGLSASLDETLLTALGPADGRPTAYHLAVALAHALRDCTDPMPDAAATTVVAAPPVGVIHRTARRRTAPGRVRRTALALTAGGLLLAVGGASLAAIDGVLARPGLLSAGPLTAHVRQKTADDRPAATQAPVSAGMRSTVAAKPTVVAEAETAVGARIATQAPQGAGAGSPVVSQPAAALDPASLAGGLARAMSGILAAGGADPATTAQRPARVVLPASIASRPAGVPVVRLPATIATTLTALTPTGDAELASAVTPHARAAVTTRTPVGSLPAVSRRTGTTLAVVARTPAVQPGAQGVDRSGRGAGSAASEDDRSGRGRDGTDREDREDRALRDREDADESDRPGKG